MESAKAVGRMIGVILLVQAVAGALTNFALLRPALGVLPGFLVNAAGHSMQIGVAVIIGLGTGALAIGMAIAALPVLRRYSHALALWFLALALLGFATQVIENIAVLSMLSLSQAYAKAGAADAGLFEALGAVIRSARNGAHYTHLFVGSSMILVLVGLLYRFALVPRVLAGFGLAAGLLQLGAIAMTFFGQRFNFSMIMPMGVAYIVIALWLIARGFDERLRSPSQTQTSTQA